MVNYDPIPYQLLKVNLLFQDAINNYFLSLSGRKAIKHVVILALKLGFYEYVIRRFLYGCFEFYFFGNFVKHFGRNPYSYSTHLTPLRYLLFETWQIRFVVELLVFHEVELVN